MMYDIPNPVSRDEEAAWLAGQKAEALRVDLLETIGRGNPSVTLAARSRHRTRLVLLGATVVAAAAFAGLAQIGGRDATRPVVAGPASTNEHESPRPTSASASSSTVTEAQPAAPPLPPEDWNALTLEVGEIVDSNQQVFLGSAAEGNRIVVAVASGHSDEASALLGDYVRRDRVILKQCGLSADEATQLRERVRAELMSRGYSFTVSFDAASCRVAALVSRLTDADADAIRAALGEAASDTVLVATPGVFGSGIGGTP